MRVLVTTVVVVVTAPGLLVVVVVVDMPPGSTTTTGSAALAELAASDEHRARASVGTDQRRMKPSMGSEAVDALVVWTTVDDATRITRVELPRPALGRRDEPARERA
ncbi:MAG: hypothetical protein K1X88_34275 [Nannocystaceae bacterium]|nr:hypothetical protein [Nannocystaceae bacterium]